MTYILRSIFFMRCYLSDSQITSGAAVDLCFGNVPKSPELEAYFQSTKDHMMFHVLLKDNPLCLIVSVETCNGPVIAVDYKLVSITGLSTPSLSHCC